MFKDIFIFKVLDKIILYIDRIISDVLLLINSKIKDIWLILLNLINVFLKLILDNFWYNVIIIKINKVVVNVIFKIENILFFIFWFIFLY